MKTLEQAIRNAKELQLFDGGSYAVVYSDGFLGRGPYWVVELGQVEILVQEGARLIWESEKVMV